MRSVRGLRGGEEFRVESLGLEEGGQQGKPADARRKGSRVNLLAQAGEMRREGSRENLLAQGGREERGQQGKPVGASGGDQEG